MLKNTTNVKGDTSQAKFTDNSHQVSPSSLLGVSAGNFQRDLVDEPEIIRTHLATHNKSEMVAVHVTPCAILPYNSNYEQQ
jgi:hypothetical protein